MTEEEVGADVGAGPAVVAPSRRWWADDQGFAEGWWGSGACCEADTCAGEGPAAHDASGLGGPAITIDADAATASPSGRYPRLE